MPALWAWFIGSRVGRWLALAGSLVLALLLLRAKWRGDGRRSAELEGARRSLDTLREQEEDRDEVVDIVRRGDGYDELRERWTRKQTRPRAD